MANQAKMPEKYRVVTYRPNGQERSLESHETLEDAREAAELMVSSGEWCMAEIQHYTHGPYGKGWYHLEMIEDRQG